MDSRRVSVVGLRRDLEKLDFRLHWDTSVKLVVGGVLWLPSSGDLGGGWWVVGWWLLSGVGDVSR